MIFPATAIEPWQYTKSPSSWLPVDRFRKQNLSSSLKRTLDRVNVLGDEEQNYGHSGCVNAVSWAENGNLLLTGGDDTTVRLWRVDTSDLKQEYPYVCRSVIATGHRANIFNVQMLPYSNRIVSCAGDKQIRVFDATTPSAVRDGMETEFSARQAGVRIIRCHSDRVKKLVTEESPDVFLSLSEDGSVRQHDLRTPHQCRESCPAPLLHMPHELSTISMSPVTPYQFVVAGESRYGYLFDRRHIGRVLQEEWGAVPNIGEDVTTCVRKFGRHPQSPKARKEGRRDHITGCRISPTNGHEVLLTYSSDKVYLFSTKDEAHTKEDLASMAAAVLPPNSEESRTRKKRRTSSPPTGSADEPSNAGDSMDVDDDREEDDADHEEVDDDEDGEEEEDEMSRFLNYLRREDKLNDGFMSDVPVVLPRASYAGARNVDTVKDVNFLGPYDEHVVSGSDDGNWFMWDKVSGKLVGIYEGDETVVNVVEAHPHLPVVAVSGIDKSIKLFAPARGKSQFSRVDHADAIIEENARLSRRSFIAYNLSSRLFSRLGALSGELGGEGSNPVIECGTQ